MSKYIDNNPWAGLSSYEDPEKAEREGRKPKLFCGRDDESHSVAQLIAGNIFVTLYGKSGTGKTSLLNAGVFPHLRQKRYLPVSIRLSMDAMEISFQQCIIKQLSLALEMANGRQQTIDVVPLSADEQQPDYLWSYFARTRFTDSEGRTLFPVIVFDQFEEVFRDRRNDAEVLLRQIAYLIDESHALPNRLINGQPYKYDFNFRFVVSIREDDLYRLEDSIDNSYLPELKRCRYRLRGLSEQGAKDVILIPGEGVFNSLNSQKIAKCIIDKSRNIDRTISTNIISLLCSRLYIVYRNERLNANTINLSQVESFIKGNPFEQFYNEATHKLSNREKTYIEEHLIDSTGRRNSIPESDFFINVKDGKSLFVGNNRILQRSSVSSDGSVYRIELIHDCFCAPLSIQKQKREKIRRLKWLLMVFLGFISCIFIILFILYQMLLVDEANWKMMENQTKAVAEKANLLIQDHDYYLARLLALRILPENLSKMNRPYVEEAEYLLRSACQQNGAILRGHTDVVSSAVLSPNEDEILSASWDKTIRIWNTKGQCLKILKGHTDIIQSVIYRSDGLQIASASNDKTVRLWNRDGRCQKILKGHTGFVFYISYSPDNKFIASSSNDGTVRIWDTGLGKCQRVLMGFGDGGNALDFSPDGKYLATNNGRVKIWDIYSGKCVKTIEGEYEHNCIKYSKDGKQLLLVAEEEIILWDIEKGECVQKFEEEKDWFSHFADYNNEENLIVSCRGNKFRVWDINSGKCLVSWNGHSDIVHSVSFFSDGERILSTSSDKTIRVWDLGRNKQNRLTIYSESESPVMFSPDDSKLISSDSSHNICIWDAITGEQLTLLKGHRDKIQSLSYSFDGKQIVSIALDSTLRIWNNDSGQCLHKIQLRDYPKSAQFSPDNQLILTCCDSTIALWDAKKGTCLNTIMADSTTFYSATFNNKGTEILYSTEEKLYIWNLYTKKISGTVEKESKFGWGKAIYSSDDKKIVLCNNLQHIVRIWDVESKRYSTSFETGGYIIDLRYSPDGRYVIVAYLNIIDIYDCLSWKKVCSLGSHEDYIISASFNMDCNEIVSASKDGTIRVWRYLPLQQLIDETRDCFKNRQLTIEERRKYYLE